MTQAPPARMKPPPGAQTSMSFRQYSFTSLGPPVTIKEDGTFPEMQHVFPRIFLALAMSVSGKFAGDPKTPDAATGHKIELSVRGLGTVYLTQSEWDSVAVYWNVFYAFLGALIVFVAGSIIYECWRSFMREWRRPEK